MTAAKVMRSLAALQRLPAAALTDAEYIALLVANYYRLPGSPRFGLLEFTGMLPDEYAGWIMDGTVPARLTRIRSKGSH